MSWLEIFRAEAEKRNAETREAVKKARAESYAAREKVRKAKYQREHRELCNRLKREWFKRRNISQKEYLKAWRAAHPGKNAEYARRHRAKMRGLRKANAI